VSKSEECDTFCLQCSDTVGWVTGRVSVWPVDMFVVSPYCCHPCSREIQNGGILLPAYPGFPGKCPLECCCIFTRATLCIERSLPSCVVRPSVCLSHYCVQTAKPILHFIDLLVAPSFHFCDSVRRYPIPRGTPSAMAQNTRG